MHRSKPTLTPTSDEKYLVIVDDKVFSKFDKLDIAIEVYTRHVIMRGVYAVKLVKVIPTEVICEVSVQEGVNDKIEKPKPEPEPKEEKQS